MPDQSLQYAAVERLIGRCVEHEGHHYRVVDFLIREQTLILRQDGTCRTIQSNQFGSPTRRVPETVEFPLYESDGAPLRQAVVEWLAALENH